MYHLFNKEEYLGHYVIRVDLQVFLDTYALNHSIGTENLHIYESEYFDAAGKVVKYSTKEILLCKIVDEDIFILRNVYDELRSDITEEEKNNILENKACIENGLDPIHPWPKKEFREIGGKEVVLETYPLKLVL
jgi:hypothetical protein